MGDSSFRRSDLYRIRQRGIIKNNQNPQLIVSINEWFLYHRSELRNCPEFASVWAGQSFISKLRRRLFLNRKSHCCAAPFYHIRWYKSPKCYIGRDVGCRTMCDQNCNNRLSAFLHNFSMKYWQNSLQMHLYSMRLCPSRLRFDILRVCG